MTNLKPRQLRECAALELEHITRTVIISTSGHCRPIRAILWFFASCEFVLAMNALKIVHMAENRACAND
jgi:hypothetical protein